MDKSKKIKGINLILNKLPKEYHYWHKFGHIYDLKFEKNFDYEKMEYIPNIKMLLTDAELKYKIKVVLINVRGLVSFDCINGFFSGLTIDDFSDCGYEKHNSFRITSFEQDISFEMYCEDIFVELSDC